MTTQQFLDGIKATFLGCAETAEKKNADYAGSDDPFANFKAVEVLGISAEQGILVRVMDKIKRVNNLLDAEAQVKDESVDDTLDDAINYLAILKQLRRSRREQ